MPFLRAVAAASVILLAGCVGGRVEAPAADAELALQSLPIDATGNVGARRCTFCEPTGAEGIAIPLEFQGRPERLELTVEWTDAPTGVDQNPEIYLMTEEPDGAWAWASDYPWETGPSPLSFEWNLSSFAGETLRLWVGAQTDVGAGDLNPGASVPRGFAATGALTFRPD